MVEREERGPTRDADPRPDPALARELERWTLAPDPEDPAELAARVAGLAGPLRPRRGRAWLAGLAAALVAFLTLAALGAEVRRDGARVSVGLRLPWLADDAPAEADPLPELVARLDALERSHELTLDLADLQARRLAQWGQRSSEERRALLAAVERALATERERTASWIDALGRDAAHQDLRTREAVAQLASLVGPQEDR